MENLKLTSEPIFYKKKNRRPLSNKQKELLNFSLNKFLLKKEILQKKNIFLEIGFGYGENLINLAKKNLDKIILGCEIYEPGIANLVNKLDKKKLKNIFIYPKNIFILFKKIKKNSVEKVFLLFPDPWPKKRHYKRRLISKLLLKEIFKVLKKDGLFYISTDSESYLDSILKEFLFNYNFLWMNKTLKDCQKRSKILIESKYEKKAKIKGNKNFFLKFKKIC